jgi:hypothetical protein
MISIGSNIPIIKSDLDIKGIIVKALEMSKLKNIVPIVCNILLGLKASTIFQHHVPYTSSLLDLLKEVQKQPQMLQSVYIQID